MIPVSLLTCITETSRVFSVTRSRSAAVLSVRKHREKQIDGTALALHVFHCFNDGFMLDGSGDEVVAAGLSGIRKQP